MIPPSSSVLSPSPPSPPLSFLPLSFSPPSPPSRSYLSPSPLPSCSYLHSHSLCHVQNIPKCSPAIYNTLLELYLSRDATRHTQLTDKQRERKIMVLLEGPEVGWDFSCRGYVHQPMSTSSLRQTTMFTMLWCWLRCTTSKLPCFTSMSTSSRCEQNFSHVKVM